MSIPENKKGVPIPPRYTEMYNWKAMEVGEVKIFKGRDVESVRNTAVKAGKRHGYKFTTRKLEDGTVGVWRIK